MGLLHKLAHVNELCTIKVKNRPTVPDNENYCQVFEGDKHIDGFMQAKNDFSIPTPQAIKKAVLMKDKFLKQSYPLLLI